MDADTLMREWGIITQLLPPGWRDLARTTGAFKRGRQVRDPGTLLQLILLHVSTGLSLRQSAARAERLALARISDVALLKRLRSSEQWLHALCTRLFAGSAFHRPLPHVAGDRAVRVVDATHVSEPGSTGTDWRVHYVLGVPSLECDFFEVTDARGGESYTRIPVRPGDIILGDRGYCRREGLAHVIKAGGDVVVRLHGSALPLLDMEGRTFDPLQAVRTLKGHEPHEWRVQFTADGQTYSARLCAVRKSDAATQHARRHIHRAARKQKQVRPATLEMAEYLVVLTTLAQDTSTTDVLELYRARWQIELAFKRLKSLFGAGHVPKYDPASARAWLHGKLLAVLLIERLSQEARFFSPWGFRLGPA